MVKNVADIDVNVYKNHDWVVESLAKKGTDFSVLDKHNSVWVAASAGSGKTYLLTARVLNLLLTDVEPSKILCITYTNAGSSEMKSRVNEVLEFWENASDEELFVDLRERIYSDSIRFSDENVREKFVVARGLFQKILALPSGLKIQTIHSFCQAILKRFPIEADVPPAFEIISDRDVDEMLDSAYKKLFLKVKSHVNFDLSDAFNFISDSNTFDTFKSMVNLIILKRRDLNQFFTRCGSYEAIKNDLEKLYFPDGIVKTTSQIKEDFLSDKSFYYTFEAFTRANIEYNNFSKKPPSRAFKIVKNCLNKFGEFQYDFQTYLELFFIDGGYGNQRVKPGEISQEFEKKYPFKNVFEIEAEKCYKFVDFFTRANDFEYNYAVACFAFEFLEGYKKEKEIKGLMDYEDLLIKVSELFKHPNFAGWVLYKLDGGVDHLLVDEAQDTSPFQWGIILSLIEEFFAVGKSDFDCKSVFVVGDKKQSIYSFQGVDTNSFSDAKMQIEARVKDKYDAGNWREISKNTSFRTSPPVLELVNAMLENKATNVGVVVDDDGDVRHTSVKFEGAGEVILFPPIIKKTSKKSVQESVDDSVEVSVISDEWKMPFEVEEEDGNDKLCAQQVADKIAEMIKDKVWLDSKKRVVEASDFMVLVKKRKKFSDYLVNALYKNKVKIDGVDSFNLNDYIAFDDLFAVLEFLLVKEDNLLFAAVLKSPLFGWTDEDIFNLRGEEKGDFYTILKNKFASSNDSNKFCKSLIIIENLIEKFEKNASPYDFYFYLLNSLKTSENFYQRLGLEFENFKDEFLKLCINYEISPYHYLGLSGFLGWVKKSTNTVKRDFSDSNGVRILTCHGSKGLESPIVIIPACFGDSNGANKVEIFFKNLEENSLSFDKSIVPILKNPYSEIGGESVVFSNLKEEKKLKIEEEQNRLIYVAMTRAREKLMVFGVEGNSWYNKISIGMDSLLTSYGVAEIDSSLPRVFKQEVLGGKKSENTDSKNENIDVNLSENFDKISAIKNNIYNDIFNKKVVDSPSYLELEKIENLEFYDGDFTLENDVNLTPESVEKSLFNLDLNSEIVGSELAMKRGVVIHKLMEYFESFKPLDKNKIKEIFQEFLNTYENLFDKEIQTKFLENILSLYDDDRFNLLFNNEFSYSELEVATEFGSVRFDKIVKRGNSIFIIDFKTDETAPEAFESVPGIYKNQMARYKKVLANIYPDCKIYASLLYLTNCTFLFV